MGGGAFRREPDYLGIVTEVEITTPRGSTLRGTFINPVDSTDAAVVFSHAFLCDRQSSLHFSVLAGKYRSLGYATLIFDYSGHGASDDDPITLDRRVEDLRAASGWLADQGFTRQLLHAHSSGSISAVKSRPKAVKSYFLTSPVLGPLDYDWEAIFSAEQLEELERKQETRILEDTGSGRAYFRITPQTLIDLSLNRADHLLKKLEQPVLMVYDSADVERGMDIAGMEIFSLLPNGSRLEIAQGHNFSQKQDLETLWQIARPWVTRQLPIRRASR